MKKTVIGLTILAFLTFPLHTLAQEATDSANPTPAPPPTPTPVDQLKSDYFFQVEKYQDAQDQFNFDKAEFYKLQTLESREKAVASLKDLLTARAKVITTYFTALERILVDAQGIDVNDKQKALSMLSQSKSIIKDHQSKIPPLEDQTAVLAESAEFEIQSPFIFETQYRVLSLLAIGRVQSTYDQLVVATQDFQSQQVEPIAQDSRKAVFERGIREIDLLNQKIDQAIKTAELRYQTLDDETTRRRPQPNSIYSAIVKDLQPAYSTMNRSLTFLKELESDI